MARGPAFMQKLLNQMSLCHQYYRECQLKLGLFRKANEFHSENRLATYLLLYIFLQEMFWVIIFSIYYFQRVALGNDDVDHCNKQDDMKEACQCKRCNFPSTSQECNCSCASFATRDACNYHDHICKWARKPDQQKESCIDYYDPEEIEGFSKICFDERQKNCLKNTGCALIDQECLPFPGCEIFPDKLKCRDSSRNCVWNANSCVSKLPCDSIKGMSDEDYKFNKEALDQLCKRDREAKIFIAKSCEEFSQSDLKELKCQELNKDCIDNSTESKNKQPCLDKRKNPFDLKDCKDYDQWDCPIKKDLKTNGSCSYDKKTNKCYRSVDMEKICSNYSVESDGQLVSDKCDGQLVSDGKCGKRSVELLQGNLRELCVGVNCENMEDYEKEIYCHETHLCLQKGHECYKQNHPICCGLMEGCDYNLQEGICDTKLENICKKFNESQCKSDTQCVWQNVYLQPYAICTQWKKVDCAKDINCYWNEKQQKCQKETQCKDVQENCQQNIPCDKVKYQAQCEFLKACKWTTDNKLCNTKTFSEFSDQQQCESAGYKYYENKNKKICKLSIECSDYEEIEECKKDSNGNNCIWNYKLGEGKLCTKFINCESVQLQSAADKCEYYSRFCIPNQTGSCKAYNASEECKNLPKETCMNRNYRQREHKKKCGIGSKGECTEFTECNELDLKGILNDSVESFKRCQDWNEECIFDFQINQTKCISKKFYEGDSKAQLQHFHTQSSRCTAYFCQTVDIDDFCGSKNDWEDCLKGKGLEFCSFDDNQNKCIWRNCSQFPTKDDCQSSQNNCKWVGQCINRNNCSDFDEKQCKAFRKFCMYSKTKCEDITCQEYKNQNNICPEKYVGMNYNIFCQEDEKNACVERLPNQDKGSECFFSSQGSQFSLQIGNSEIKQCIWMTGAQAIKNNKKQDLILIGVILFLNII